MKKQYIMGLLFGISMSMSPLSYSMLEEDWEMVHHTAVQPLADFFTAYNKASLKRTFVISANGTQKWTTAMDTIKTFVLNNSKNYIGVTDKDLITALEQFLVVSKAYHNIIANSDIPSAKIIETSLKVLDSAARHHLTKKHMTKNKEEARVALKEATAILRKHVHELFKLLPEDV